VATYTKQGQDANTTILSSGAKMKIVITVEMTEEQMEKIVKSSVLGGFLKESINTKGWTLAEKKRVVRGTICKIIDERLRAIVR
jgi:hypothetical protein